MIGSSQKYRESSNRFGYTHGIRESHTEINYADEKPVTKQPREPKKVKRIDFRKLRVDCIEDYR